MRVVQPAASTWLKKEFWRRKLLFLDQGRLGPLMKRLPTSQWEGLLRKHLAKKNNFSAARGLSAGLAACIMEKWPSDKSNRVQKQSNPPPKLHLTTEHLSNSKQPPHTSPESMSTHPPAIWWQEPQILAFASEDCLFWACSFAFVFFSCFTPVFSGECYISFWLLLSGLVGLLFWPCNGIFIMTYPFVFLRLHPPTVMAAILMALPSDRWVYLKLWYFS